MLKLTVQERIRQDKGWDEMAEYFHRLSSLEELALCGSDENLLKLPSTLRKLFLSQENSSPSLSEEAIIKAKKTNLLHCKISIDIKMPEAEAEWGW